MQSYSDTMHIKHLPNINLLLCVATFLCGVDRKRGLWERNGDSDLSCISFIVSPIISFLLHPPFLFFKSSTVLSILFSLYMWDFLFTIQE